MNLQVPQHPISMRSVWDPLARWQLGRAIRSEAPQIVQTWMGRATRLVSLPKGRQPIHIARLGGYYDVKGYRHAHAWIGNTKGICDYLVREGLPAGRVFHIGNFIEPIARPPQPFVDQFRVEWRLPPNACVLFAAGRLHPNKGFADLLDAFSRLPHDIHGRQLRLVLAGDGPLAAELHAQAEQLNIQDRVIWAGWQQDLAPLFALADGFVCPSVHEPLGNVLLEAWANDVPLLSTDTDGALELMTHEVDGLIVPKNDPQALAQAMLEMLEMSPAARTALVSAGRQSLLASHGKQTIVTAYTELYQRLISTCAA
jgi:glycosyltransferase involved in cell wall biosynthesis